LLADNADSRCDQKILPDHAAFTQCQKDEHVRAQERLEKRRPQQGRNILIIIIVAIIASAATIGLSIRQAADSARQNGLQNTSVTAQISLDRSKLISAAKSSGSGSTGADAKPDFETLRKTLNDKGLKLADYEKYKKASSSIASTYYSQTTALSATDAFQPVETSDSASSSNSTGTTSSDDSSQASTDGNDANTNQGESGQAGGFRGGSAMADGAMAGGMGAERTTQGDFSLTGFSSDTAVDNARNGKFTMSSGKVFGYTAASNNDIIISKSLADFNNLKVGDSVSTENTSDTTTTYTLKIVGIYKDSTDTSTNQMGGFARSTSSDPANAIYTSVSTLKALGLDSDSGDDDAAQLSYTYVFANKSAYETFVKDVKKAGLSSDYTVSSADVEEYEASLVPLDNLSKFAATLLLIVLGVGAVVLIVLNLFNVRERKYEVGVLTAIGIRKAKVAIQFVIELFIVTMVGLAIGVAAGAATSIPISNQMLSSQVSAQETTQQSQQQQFGRDMQGAGNAQGSTGNGLVGTSGSQSGDSAGSSTDKGSSSHATASGKNATSAGTAGRFGNKSPFGRATNYISSVNATVNLKVVGQLVLIGIVLTVISGLVAVIFVMRYEPLQILADRS
jgi:putative ABC transport system permease protein